MEKINEFGAVDLLPVGTHNLVGKSLFAINLAATMGDLLIDWHAANFCDEKIKAEFLPITRTQRNNRPLSANFDNLLEMVALPLHDECSEM